MDDQKNFLLAMVLSGLVLLGYWFFIGEPTARQARADAESEIARKSQFETTQPVEVVQPKPRQELLTSTDATQRVKIDTPGMRGSFRVQGSRLDDVTLKNYEKTLDPADGQVELLNPEGAEQAAFVMDNWIAPGVGNGSDTPWQLISGSTLRPNSPLTLETQIGDIQITRTVSIDDRYLITLSDQVVNTGSTEASVVRTGVSRQYGLPQELTNFFVIQEGPISVVSNAYHDWKYKKLRKSGSWSEKGEGGWVGLTDKYWLQAAIAPQGKTITATYEHRNVNDADVYETSYATDPLTLTPGASIESVGYIFAGAKDRDVLNSYENELGITQMSSAIGWGLLKILVKPISWSLSWLGDALGNYGLGILALTFTIKLLMFPLFNKQYESQAKMKKVAPKLKVIQTRYKEDRVKLQQEMMKLYKTEGVNPAAGCLPIIPTMFVFFALYKSVFINIDLRHEPFFGWIRDLSAKDPISLLNGFGTLPWGPDPLGIPFLAIGPLALMYGFSMAAMFTLTPPAGDPMQQKIFKFMPWVFMFVLAPFAAGLLVYWIWNNILSFLQQYYITRKFKVDTPVDKFWRKITGKPEPEPES